ncbi:hypothetical protein EI94DRAFT_1696499 [Lactarius quietus]|nr:hypothetical protein EI94DRAFT_1696499 [Lactarius quietus]
MVLGSAKKYQFFLLSCAGDKAEDSENRFDDPGSLCDVLYSGTGNGLVLTGVISSNDQEGICAERIMLILADVVLDKFKMELNKGAGNGVDNIGGLNKAIIDCTGQFSVSLSTVVLPPTRLDEERCSSQKSHCHSRNHEGTSVVGTTLAIIKFQQLSHAQFDDNTVTCWSVSGTTTSRGVATASGKTRSGVRGIGHNGVIGRKTVVKEMEVLGFVRINMYSIAVQAAQNSGNKYKQKHQEMEGRTTIRLPYGPMADEKGGQHAGEEVAQGDDWSRFGNMWQRCKSVKSQQYAQGSEGVTNKIPHLVIITSQSLGMMREGDKQWHAWLHPLSPPPISQLDDRPPPDSIEHLHAPVPPTSHLLPHACCRGHTDPSTSPTHSAAHPWHNAAHGLVATATAIEDKPGDIPTCVLYQYESYGVTYTSTAVLGMSQRHSLKEHTKREQGSMLNENKGWIGGGIVLSFRFVIKGLTVLRILILLVHIIMDMNVLVGAPSSGCRQVLSSITVNISNQSSVVDGIEGHVYWLKIRVMGM